MSWPQLVSSLYLAFSSDVYVWRAGRCGDDYRQDGYVCTAEILGTIMSDFTPNDESVARTTAPKSIWLKELPYAVVLILTLLGVAYTSFTRRPTTGYWEFLVPVMGAVLYLERLALRAR